MPSKPCAACSRRCSYDARPPTPTHALDLVADEIAGANAPCVTSSFQAECVVLVHMLQRVRPDIPVLFLDTVHHFPQTLAYRDEIARKWNLNLVTLRAAGPQPGLWQQDLKACCGVHKVEPLFGALERYDTWFTGLRREQSPTRATLDEIEPFSLPTGTVAAQGEPARALAHEGRLGLRQGARHPAAAALRPRLHQHRLRAVHDRCRSTRRTNAQAAGAARSWNAASICNRLSNNRVPGCLGARCGVPGCRVPGAECQRAGVPGAGDQGAGCRKLGSQSAGSWKLPAGQFTLRPLTSRAGAGTAPRR